LQAVRDERVWSDRMLDAYVIEEIKRREQRPGRDERPVAELPIPPPPEERPPDREPERPERGVVIIDLD
jgi:hypothetical protein